MVETPEIMKAIVVGDSVAVVIPKRFRDKLKIENGNFIKVSVKDKTLVMEVVK